MRMWLFIHALNFMLVYRVGQRCTNEYIEDKLDVRYVFEEVYGLFEIMHIVCPLLNSMTETNCLTDD